MRKITYTTDNCFGRIMVTDKNVIIVMITTSDEEHINVVPKTNKHGLESAVADVIGSDDMELREMILADLVL